MGRKTHNPSLTRKIARELKQGQSPEALLPVVNSITDSYYSCLSYFHLASSGFKGAKQTNNVFDLGFKNLRKVSQPWRRIELLGKITNILKKVSDTNVKSLQYNRLLSNLDKEKPSDSKDFFVKHSKNFPSTMLNYMLQETTKLREHEFAASKAVIRAWINKGKKDILLDHISELKSDIKVKLLGYTHLQFHKQNEKVSPTALEVALEVQNAEKHLDYLVRICSTSDDMEVLSKRALGPDILLALAVRADRKGLTDYYSNTLLKAKKAIDSLPSSKEKDRLLSKYEMAKAGSSDSSSKATGPTSTFTFDLAEKGNHTLGLFNTYGGNWNHPHFKAVYKASKLCAAFDLDLALIGFPAISSEKLVKEVNKEMRVTRNDFLSELLSLERVLFFEKDIDESLAGKKVVTTSDPDTNKTTLPREKLCMIMGLGPKGLPKSYLNKADYHFELTGLNVAFETGTAMGALSSELAQLS